MKVQLLYFQGCPNIEATRTALREALALEGLRVPIEEIDVEDPAAPAWARGWGSPTILVDGEDVAGHKPSTSPACRLYPGGSPGVADIRARLATRPVRADRRIALPMVAAIGAAVAASACCLVPAVLAIVGMSGAVGARLSPYRPYFLIATALALGAAFWFAYRPRVDGCGCAAPRRRAGSRIGLWIVTMLVVGFAAYPYLSSGAAIAGSAEIPASATLRLQVVGMDCAECTGAIAKRLKAIPGVVSASVDFETGIAIVRFDGREELRSAAIAAVEAAGFGARIERQADR